MEVIWYWAFGLVLSAFISFIIGYVYGNKTKKPKYDGQLIIGVNEDRDQFQFIFETELEDLKNQSVLTMEIIHSQN